MSGWSSYLFGASIFFGAGVMMLTGQISGWWTIVSIVIMFFGAAAGVTRSIVEYRHSRDLTERDLTERDLTETSSV